MAKAERWSLVEKSPATAECKGVDGVLDAGPGTRDKADSGRLRASAGHLSPCHYPKTSPFYSVWPWVL